MNMVTILMMPAKMATPVLLKIKVFWNKGYDVIIFVHDVTSKIFSRYSIYTVGVVMWPKFGNSSISMREIIITYHKFRYGHEILHQRGKRVITKSQKVLWANLYVCGSYRGKTGMGEGGGFLPPYPE